MPDAVLLGAETDCEMRAQDAVHDSCLPQCLVLLDMPSVAGLAW